MRPIRFTKAEAVFVREAIATHTSPWGTAEAKAQKMAASVNGKLDEADGPAPAGVAVGPIEQALERTARGKVVRLAGNAYGRASKQATAVGATVEDAEVIGAWLARQGWLRDPLTILTVLNKWPDWLARARATIPPPKAEEGFDRRETDVGTPAGGVGGEGGRGGGGTRRPGFGS